MLPLLCLFIFSTLVSAAIGDRLGGIRYGKRHILERDVQPVCSCGSPNKTEWQNISYYSAVAAAATIPSGYENTGTNEPVWSTGDAFLGTIEIGSYDAELAASLCDNIDECSSFQIYFEQVVNSIDAVVKGAFWAGSISSSRNTRFVVNTAITGCNAYMNNSITTKTAGFSSPSWLGKRIIVVPSGSNASNAFVGSQYFGTSPFSTDKCASACSTTSGCIFFNTYMMFKDGSNQGQWCDMYSQPISQEYATNTGSSNTDGNYTIGYSYTGGLATLDDNNLPSMDTDPATTAGWSDWLVSHSVTSSSSSTIISSSMRMYSSTTSHGPSPTSQAVYTTRPVLWSHTSSPLPGHTLTTSSSPSSSLSTTTHRTFDVPYQTSSLRPLSTPTTTTTLIPEPPGNPGHSKNASSGPTPSLNGFRLVINQLNIAKRDPTYIGFVNEEAVAVTSKLTASTFSLYETNLLAETFYVGPAGTTGYQLLEEFTTDLPTTSGWSISENRVVMFPNGKFCQGKDGKIYVTFASNSPSDCQSIQLTQESLSLNTTLPTTSNTLSITSNILPTTRNTLSTTSNTLSTTSNTLSTTSHTLSTTSHTLSTTSNTLSSTSNTLSITSTITSAASTASSTANITHASGNSTWLDWSWANSSNATRSGWFWNSSMLNTSYPGSLNGSHDQTSGVATATATNVLSSPTNIIDPLATGGVSSNTTGNASTIIRASSTSPISSIVDAVGATTATSTASLSDPISGLNDTTGAWNGSWSDWNGTWAEWNASYSETLSSSIYSTYTSSFAPTSITATAVSSSAPVSVAAIATTTTGPSDPYSGYNDTGTWNGSWVDWNGTWTEENTIYSVSLSSSSLYSSLASSSASISVAATATASQSEPTGIYNDSGTWNGSWADWNGTWPEDNATYSGSSSAAVYSTLLSSSDSVTVGPVATAYSASSSSSVSDPVGPVTTSSISDPYSGFNDTTWNGSWADWNGTWGEWNQSYSELLSASVYSSLTSILSPSTADPASSAFITSATVKELSTADPASSASIASATASFNPWDSNSTWGGYGNESWSDWNGSYWDSSSASASAYSTLTSSLALSTADPSSPTLTPSLPPATSSYSAASPTSGAGSGSSFYIYFSGTSTIGQKERRDPGSASYVFFPSGSDTASLTTLQSLATYFTLDSDGNLVALGQYVDTDFVNSSEFSLVASVPLAGSIWSRGSDGTLKITGGERACYSANSVYLISGSSNLSCTVATLFVESVATTASASSLASSTSIPTTSGYGDSPSAYPYPSATGYGPAYNDSVWGDWGGNWTWPLNDSFSGTTVTTPIATTTASVFTSVTESSTKSLSTNTVDPAETALASSIYPSASSTGFQGSYNTSWENSTWPNENTTWADWNSTWPSDNITWADWPSNDSDYSTTANSPTTIRSSTFNPSSSTILDPAHTTQTTNAASASASSAYPYPSASGYGDPYNSSVWSDWGDGNETWVDWNSTVYNNSASPISSYRTQTPGPTLSPSSTVDPIDFSTSSIRSSYSTASTSSASGPSDPYGSNYTSPYADNGTWPSNETWSDWIPWNSSFSYPNQTETIATTSTPSLATASSTSYAGVTSSLGSVDPERTISISSVYPSASTTGFEGSYGSGGSWNSSLDNGTWSDWNGTWSDWGNSSYPFNSTYDNNSTEIQTTTTIRSTSSAGLTPSSTAPLTTASISGTIPGGSSGGGFTIYGYPETEKRRRDVTALYIYFPAGSDTADMTSSLASATYFELDSYGNLLTIDGQYINTAVTKSNTAFSKSDSVPTGSVYWQIGADGSLTLSNSDESVCYDGSGNVYLVTLASSIQCQIITVYQGSATNVTTTSTTTPAFTSSETSSTYATATSASASTYPSSNTSDPYGGYAGNDTTWSDFNGTWGDWPGEAGYNGSYSNSSDLTSSVSSYSTSTALTAASTLSSADPGSISRTASYGPLETGDSTNPYGANYTDPWQGWNGTWADWNSTNLTGYDNTTWPSASLTIAYSVSTSSPASSVSASSVTSSAAAISTSDPNLSNYTSPYGAYNDTNWGDWSNSSAYNDTEWSDWTNSSDYSQNSSASASPFASTRAVSPTSSVDPNTLSATSSSVPIETGSPFGSNYTSPYAYNQSWPSNETWSDWNSTEPWNVSSNSSYSTNVSSSVADIGPTQTLAVISSSAIPAPAATQTSDPYSESSNNTWSDWGNSSSVWSDWGNSTGYNDTSYSLNNTDPNTVVATSTHALATSSATSIASATATADPYSESSNSTVWSDWGNSTWSDWGNSTAYNESNSDSYTNATDSATSSYTVTTSSATVVTSTTPTSDPYAESSNSTDPWSDWGNSTTNSSSVWSDWGNSTTYNDSSYSLNTTDPNTSASATPIYTAATSSTVSTASAVATFDALYNSTDPYSNVTNPWPTDGNSSSVWADWGNRTSYDDTYSGGSGQEDAGEVDAGTEESSVPATTSGIGYSGHASSTTAVPSWTTTSNSAWSSTTSATPSPNSSSSTSTTSTTTDPGSSSTTSTTTTVSSTSTTTTTTTTSPTQSID